MQYNHEAAISIKGGFLHRNTPFAAEYAATFECASLRFCTLHPETIHLGTDDGHEEITISGDAYCNELKYFVECITQRVPPKLCLPESSLQAIELCRMIRAKAE